MNQNYNEEFRSLSEVAAASQRKGDFITFSQTHKKMAAILHNEGDYLDEIKSRIIAFYFDTSGLSQQVYIDAINTEAVALAAGNAGIGEKELSCLYFDTIRNDTAPMHPMTVKGSYKLLTLCIRNQWKKANKIVENLK